MACAAAVCAAAVLGGSPISRGAVVINEVYAGGGSAQTTAAYKTDFIELVNTSPTAVDISGYSLAYGSSTQTAGNFPTAVGTVPTGTTLDGLSYFLVRTGTPGTGGANDPTPDLTGSTTANLSNTTGSLRLTDGSATPVVLDIVGWGASNNFEGSTESTPASVAVSLQRFPDGTDNNNNQSDFIQATPTPKAVNTPEPGCVGLIGLAGLLMLRRRQTA